ncbi:uncharacterized protein [Choristoneura fumiferana]|uniref:uncharacterized protein n=1 Tax=Choristoneura fumiferana TaxID=7141 RepID=UPI003D15B9F1
MLTNCCGDKDLREGTQIIAFLAGLKMFAGVIFAILAALPENINKGKEGLGSSIIIDIAVVIFGSLMIPYVISVILLYVGLARENGWLMLPWLIISALIEIAVLMIGFYESARNKDIKGFISFVVLLGMDSYFELVVISYFLELVS